MSRLSVAAALLALAVPAAAVAQASPSPFTSGQRYDAMGRITGTISADPDGPGGNPYLATRNTYDGAGRLVRAETGTLSAWQSEAVAPADWGAAFDVSRTQETSFDAMGRKRRELVREGAAGAVRTLTQYSYDGHGRLECTAVRMNSAAFGALPESACSLSSYDPALGYDRIGQIVYDAAGQRLQLREGLHTAAAGTEATWAYNLDGQVTGIVDGNGNRAELRYDGHGRQSCWLFPSPGRPAAFDDSSPALALATAGAVNGDCVSQGDFESYAYDAAGNRTDLRKRDGRHIAFAYDALNRVTAKTYPQGGARPVHYGYDLRNLQLHARFDSPTGEGVTNAYDGFGRLASSSVDLGGVTRTLAYTSDRNGNRSGIRHPDLALFTFDIDGLNRFSGINESGSSDVVTQTWRPAGERFIVNRGGSATGYVYDGIGRLSYLVDDLPNGAGTNWSFARNAASQIASATRSNDDYAWAGHYPANRAYTANGLNQYSAAGSASFVYDANGNLTGDGSRTFTYDIENRLIGASGGLTLSYDTLGRLYEASGPSGTTRFLYDGDALVGEYDSAGTMLRRYVHGGGIDEPLLWYEGAGVSWANRRQLFADHQGSIVAIADAVGNRLSVNAYDEYGIPAAGNTGRFRYTGQIWLSDLGMYYYKARIYSPTLGRFMQTDPIGYQDQFNLYAYVGNDPVNATDPSGEYKCTDSEKQCARIAEHAAEIRRGGAAASQVTGTRIRSSYAASLNSLAGFIGRPGEENGVEITSGHLDPTILGTNERVSGGIRLTLDFDQIDRQDGSTAAGVLAHEGTHGQQLRAWGPPSPADTYGREINANVNESLTNEFLGQRSSLWSPTMTARDRWNRIGRASFLSCREARRAAPSAAAGRYVCPQ